MNLGFIPAKHAALSPSRTALVDVVNQKRMTYGELDRRVRRLANALVGELGLEKGARVANLSKNSAEYLECYYACARAGLVTQPLNWRLGEDELARIVKDGEPSVILSSTELRGSRDALQRRVDVPLWFEHGTGSDGSYEALLERASEDEPAHSRDVGGSDPALILYTGGTTGESKGALHSHDSFWSGMINQTVAERIVPSDVYLLTGQMFHIPVGLAMNYQAHGCPLVLMNFEARQALEVIQAERVSSMLGITTMLNWMMAVPGFERYDLSSLRNMQYGGGPMPPAVVRRALEAFPCTLIQGYGQTEGMTMCFLSQEDHADAVRGVHPERLASCGRPSFLTDVMLADAEGRPVPKDNRTPGHILVGSPANMLGYWRRPDLTAETLRGGYMWTGDIATWDEDGYVFIVDRAKDMIISGGEKIYSTQVEAAILENDAVLEAAVIGVPDDAWGEAVKAVVVLRPGRTATAQEIIATVKSKLGSYQKPKSVELVDALPKA